jgi:two-component system LytT family sensor kinase
VALFIVVFVIVGVPSAAGWLLMRSRRAFTSVTERATYDVLHTANLAAPPLRAGLNEVSAHRAIRHLRALLGTPAVALTDTTSVLAWDGIGEHHSLSVMKRVGPVLSSGRSQAFGSAELVCGDQDCPLQAAVAVPVVLGEEVVGTLWAFDAQVGPGLVQTTSAVSRWVATQLELAELDQAKVRLAQSQLRLLRAQISPHFIYNALTAIASFVRTDPDRARELLVGFADFTRYSFRSHGDFTTLSEELRSVDTYLMLERARFGDRLSVTLRVAPEVLGVAVPFLVLQPLVENAVRHGLEGKSGVGRISIVAENDGAECRIIVEDDGVGMDPERLQERLDGKLIDSGGGGVGMHNVDERLRQVFGADYGLEVDTALGAGTRVVLRVPKYRAGVRAS